MRIETKHRTQGATCRIGSGGRRLNTTSSRRADSRERADGTGSAAARARPSLASEPSARADALVGPRRLGDDAHAFRPRTSKRPQTDATAWKRYSDIRLHRLEDRDLEGAVPSRAEEDDSLRAVAGVARRPSPRTITNCGTARHTSPGNPRSRRAAVKAHVGGSLQVETSRPTRTTSRRCSP